MEYSSVKIVFNSVADLDQEINISESTRGLNLNETFKKLRFRFFEVSVPIRNTITGIYKGYMSENYKDAFDKDYNETNLFTVTSMYGSSGGGTVIITANYSNAVFGLQRNTTNAVITIDNKAVDTLDIISIDFYNSVEDKNQNVRVKVTTNTLATKWEYPVYINGLPVINENSNNPFYFEFGRGIDTGLRVENSIGQKAFRFFSTPKLLNPSNFNLRVFNTPEGSTVTISNINSEGLVLQYSLDNYNWQASNVFSRMDSGDFTLYIKDQYECIVSKLFKVSNVSISNPYFRISKSNSIRYAERIVFGNSGNYKNDENTLSCEADVPLAYKEIQQFQSSDNITTQFKSNYAENDAVVIRENGSEVPITVIKRSSNIGLKEKRDAFKYDLGGGKTGIYFTYGNIYSYNSESIISTHELNGSLPFWGQIKKYVSINGTWFIIDEIIFDDNINAEVLVVSDNYSGLPVKVIAGSIYSVFDYEVYEYTIDMSSFANENIRVRLINTDPTFGTVTHLSELINVSEKHEKTIEIRYRNEDNTDIFYVTGIEHMIRQPYIKIGGFSEDSSENYKTDTNTILLSSEIYEGDEFILEPVTKEMMRKIVRALSHKIVYIDEVGYCKNGSIEVEGPLEQSNLYAIKAKMIKNGNVYNINSSSGDNDEIYDGESYEVIGLVNSGAGFMKF